MFWNDHTRLLIFRSRNFVNYKNKEQLIMILSIREINIQSNPKNIGRNKDLFGLP